MYFDLNPCIDQKVVEHRIIIIWILPTVVGLKTRHPMCRLENMGACSCVEPAQEQNHYPSLETGLYTMKNTIIKVKHD